MTFKMPFYVIPDQYNSRFLHAFLNRCVRDTRRKKEERERERKRERERNREKEEEKKKSSFLFNEPNSRGSSRLTKKSRL
jgi:hypothetical protein